MGFFAVENINVLKLNKAKKNFKKRKKTLYAEILKTSFTL